MKKDLKKVLMAACCLLPKSLYGTGRSVKLGLSYMGGVYNKFEDDGLVLDKKRRVNVFAIDFNTTLPKLNTFINGEWAWVKVDVPDTYTEQFGKKTTGRIY